MNSTGKSALPAQSRPTAPAMKPWWLTSWEAQPSVGGALDPAAPRALWRLIQIGEMAGLIPPAAANRIAESPLTGVSHAAVLAELARFQSNPAELYVLVTLFAAAPRPVSLTILARETLVPPDELRHALDHLHQVGAIDFEPLESEEAGLFLPPAGSRLAVFLMHRVITAAF